MNIVNRLFALQIGRRADLSGLPFGFLFIWRPQSTDSRFGPVAGRMFQFYLPYRFAALEKWLWPRRENLEVVQLRDDTSQTEANAYSNFEKARDTALARMMKENPGARIVSRWDRSDRRIDLSSMPTQIYTAVTIEKAA